jgi:hypothetical protein
MAPLVYVIAIGLSFFRTEVKPLANTFGLPSVPSPFPGNQAACEAPTLRTGTKRELTFERNGRLVNSHRRI